MNCGFSSAKKYTYSSILLVFFILLFSNCSKTASNGDIIFIPEKDTIRNEAITRIKDSNWTSEIHESKLSKENSKKDIHGIFYSSVKLSSNLYIQAEKKKIFPELENFGSLDTSNIDSTTKLEITKLINKIKEENITKTDFLDGYNHEKILMNYEFSKHQKISSYILGKPIFIEEDEISIPVQFSFINDKLNSVITFKKENNIYKIKQIIFGEYFSD